MSGGETLLVEARGLTKAYVPRPRWFGAPTPAPRAVDGVDLEVRRGETVGLVGESGSGKSTTGRLLVRLLDPDAGTLRFDGHDLLALPPRELRRMRRHFQIVFQDPYGSLNPRMRVESLVREPLDVHGIGGSKAERRERVARLLEEVGLDRAALDKFPAAFSGGQRQRIGIARAVACEPKFLVADEPVSALDPPVQAQIVNLLEDLRERRGLAMLYIAHDLAMVRHLGHRVAVMYLGRIVEEGPAADVYRAPMHPYTQALLAATPASHPGIVTAPRLKGETPSPSAPLAGCRFHPRCPLADEVCRTDDPVLLPAGPGRRVACHHAKPPGALS